MAFDLVARLKIKDEITPKLSSVKKQLDEVKKATDSYRDANGRLRGANGKFIQDMNKSTEAITKQKKAFSQLESGGKKALKSLGGLAKNASLGVLGLGVAGVGAAGYLGATSIKKAMNFESELSTIKALTGATQAEMQRMQALALQQGAVTKYSALEAAQGITELLKSGITPAQVEAGALNAALNLATAGSLGLAEAAEIMSTSLNSYKKDALTAAQAADILAGTANASATDVHDLRYSLSAVGAVADGVGMSFKDTNTALGVFANNGLKGSDAGTSLKTMLLNLSPATKKARETMMDLGIMTEKGANLFYNASDELKSLDEIAGVLRTTLDDLTARERQDALRDLFGTDGIRAANILYKEGAAGVKKFYDEMLKVTALDVAKEKMNNAAGAVEQFQGAWETLQISAMLPTLPIIKDLALAAADFIGRYSPAITKAMEDMVSSAKDYVNTNFINNPEFQKLPDLKSKIKFVFNDIMQDFKGWLNVEGYAKIKQVSSTAVDILAGALEASGPLISAATTIGTAVASGVIDGFVKTIADNPTLAALIGGGAGLGLGKTFGLPGALIGTVVGAGAGAAGSKAAEVGIDAKARSEAAKSSGGSTYIPGSESKPNTTSPGKGLDFYLNPKSGGLDRVPYHRYPALLHKDEMVLNATEARKFRGDGGAGSGNSGGIVIQMHGTVIREDADVERIATELANRVGMHSNIIRRASY